jgi:hypothetical protein
MKGRFGPLMAIGSVMALWVSPLAHGQTPKEPDAATRLKEQQAIKEEVLARQLGAAANQGDLTARLIEQNRPVFCVEYHFLRMVCGLTEDERKAFARAAVQSFKDAMARYDEMRRAPQLRPAGAPPRALPDPRKLIQEGLVRVAERHLSAERAARYREELAQRSLDRKRVTIQRLIEWLDQELILSPMQRIELATALTAGWDDAWFPTEFMLANPERYLSRIPSQNIVRWLEVDQRQLFDQLVRNPANIAGVVMNSIAAFPEDEELAAARAAEAREAEVSP